MTRIPVLGAGLAVLLAVTLAACGAQPGDGAAAGACPQDQPDCVDTPELTDDDPVAIGEEGVEQLRRDAQFYLGKPQSELNELIRVGRIDDEQMMLTQDYQVGRITVELDTRDGDEPVVTSATVELPDGPETFALQE